MYCGRCGSHITEGSSCCPYCGRQVASTGFVRAADLEDHAPVYQSAPAAPPVQTCLAYTEPPVGAVSPVKTTSVSSTTDRLAPAGFCGGCGAPLEPGQDACLACGRRVGPACKPKCAIPEAPKPTKPKKKSKAPLVILLTLALLLIAGAAVLALYLVMGVNQPEAVAKDYMEAVLTADAGAVVDLLPEDVYADVMEAAGYDEREAFCTQKSGDMDEMLSLFNLVWGPGWTYEIKSAEAIESNDEELEILCEKYEQEYDFEIQNAVVVSVDVQFQGSLRREIQTEKVYLIQVNNNWYLDYLSNPNLFHS